MELKGMNTIKFDRLLISKIDDIRDAGDGKITRKAINKALDVSDDDEETIKLIQKQLRRSKCIERRGKYYTFLVEEVIDIDEDVINSDPRLQMMMSVAGTLNVFTSKTTPVAPKDLVKKCKHCKRWSREKKTCTKKPGRHLGVHDACEDEFLFNPASLYRERRRRR